MLPEVKKILYASDIDKGSRPAFRTAMSLCAHYNSEVTYLHVLESQNASTDNIMKSLLKDESMQALYDKGIENLRTKLTDRIDSFCAAELEADDGVEVSKISSRIEEGTAWKVILDVADEMDADLIIMGTRSHNAIGSFLMGSTANKVMQKSSRPVLVVPLFKEND